MKIFRILLFLCFLLTQVVNASAAIRNVTLRKSKPFKEQINATNTNYIIKYTFDLKGETLDVPDNCCLSFKGGIIKNGNIKGNGTKIKAGKRLLFEKVGLSGIWENDTVYSEWLNFKSGCSADNKDEFINLMTLANGVVYTHLYMQRGTYYCSVVEESSFIKVPSNVYWHNEATICQHVTNLHKYAFVLIKKSDNVTIDGGSFIGDVRRHIDKGGEWGHGLKIAGATNVTIKNISINEFWGDGIDIIEGEYNSTLKAGVGICKNVVLENVRCQYNRRTGFSIEAVDHAVIKNSEFSYTGALRMTAPGDGVDIEPWCRNGKKVNDVVFQNCKVKNNKGERDFACQPNIKYYDDRKRPERHPACDIKVEKCQIGNLYILLTHETVFSQCQIDNMIRYVCSHDVTFKDCVIKKRTDNDTNKGVVFINCSK